MATLETFIKANYDRQADRQTDRQKKRLIAARATALPKNVLKLKIHSSKTFSEERNLRQRITKNMRIDCGCSMRKFFFVDQWILIVYSQSSIIQPSSSILHLIFAGTEALQAVSVWCIASHSLVAIIYIITPIILSCFLPVFFSTLPNLLIDDYSD